MLRFLDLNDYKLYLVGAILLSALGFGAYSFFRSQNREESSRMFQKLLDGDLSYMDKIMVRKDIYGDIVKLLKIAEATNRGDQVRDNLIHRNISLKPMFAVITHDKSTETMGFLQKRTSPWYTFTRFLRGFDGRESATLGEVALCNAHLIVSGLDLNEDMINESAQKCTQKLTITPDGVS